MNWRHDLTDPSGDNTWGASAYYVPGKNTEATVFLDDHLRQLLGVRKQRPPYLSFAWVGHNNVMGWGTGRDGGVDTDRNGLDDVKDGLAVRHRGPRPALYHRVGAGVAPARMALLPKSSPVWYKGPSQECAMTRWPLLFAAFTGCSASNAYFTPGDDISAVVAGEVGAAEDAIDLAIYTFTDTAIADALGDAASVRGVDVRVCADAEQAYTIVQTLDLMDALEEAGAEVRVADGNGGGIMHHKFAVIDARTVLTGSYNYTLSANSINDENLVVLTDPRLAADYSLAFEELWARCVPR